MPDTSNALHPLLLSAKLLLTDLMSTLVFLGVYVLAGSVILATGLAIAFGLGIIAVARWRGRPVDAMQWLTLGLVIVFGGASLLTHDPAFVKIQPTLIYAAVAVVMLRPGWMTRYLPPIARERAGDVANVFGYVWSALMLATSVINLVLAVWADQSAWAWFIGTFPFCSKLVMFVAQYVVTRIVVRRRIRASTASPPSAA